jgi:hypothetical protein
LLLAALLCLTSAGCSSAITIGPFSTAKPAAPVIPGEPSIELAAGAPILAGAGTPQLPAEADGQPLTPVAAFGSGIIVRAGTAGSSGATATYDLWDPSSGSLNPLPNWPASAGSNDRVIGATGAWIVLLSGAGASGSAGAQPSDVSVVLFNPQTGATGAIGMAGDGNSFPVATVADGWVAWVDATPNRSGGVHAYDVVNGVDHIIPARPRGLSTLALGGGSIAWWQSFGDQGPRVVIRDIATGESHTVATGSVSALALSSDGKTLAWLRDSTSGAPGLFLRNLTTGDGGRLLGGQAAGVSLSASGNYISWQPGPGSTSSTAGTYNVQTHELRLVQTAPGTSTRLARVLGPWFVWSLRSNQAPAAQSGLGSTPSYFLRLPG